MLVTIALTSGDFATIDDEDYQKVSIYTWYAQKKKNTTYAIACVWSEEKNKWITLRMHRYLMGIQDSKLSVDHKDGNGLNNQKDNLRTANPHQNGANRRASGRSKYLGVSYDRYNSDGKIYEYWVVKIKLPDKRRVLGRFPYTDEGERMAAKKYDESAKEVHKEFAKLNFTYE